MYLFVKQIHVACVALSLAGFVARGALMAAGSPLLQARFVRIAPHIVDTALLASAIWLAWTLRQYPFVHGWLTAKVLGLIAYIGFGTMALKRGRTLRVRLWFFFLALLAAAYIVAVALTRDPAAPLAWLR
ncbi:MAG: SirB2 family protein [Woeseiaceae bacterium]